MARSLWLVATRCTDPAREAEFNSWYDQFHLPDMLAVPHVVAAQRYTLAAAPPARWTPRRSIWPSTSSIRRSQKRSCGP